MQHIALITAALLCSSSMAEATVTTFTSSTDFHAANPDATMIENFEDSDPAIRNGAYPSYTGPSSGITFTAISSYPFTPNIYLTAPGFNSYGYGLNPTTSVILAATGNEDWVATLANPTNVIGFDVLLNDWPLTITFFSGTTALATMNFDAPPADASHLAFAGISSTDPITSFHWEATNGEYIDTGIDNIFAGPLSAVPEPSTWTMMLLGFGAVGAALRKSRKSPGAILRRSANG
jgi:hypothetical protein